MAETWELAALVMVSRHIPNSLKRRLLEEAGYRCAVPTCRATDPLQFEHIEGWAETREHNFEDMIILCANCHSRVTSKKINKSAIKTYKHNLAILTGRYSLFEMRILESLFKDGPKAPIEVAGTITVSQWVLVAFSDQYHLKGLIDDKLVNFTGSNWGKEPIDPEFPNRAFVNLTPKGVEFVNSYFSGREIS